MGSQRFLGFVLGAALGVFLVFWITAEVKDDVAANNGYQGWDFFLAVTLSVPSAILMGYLMRNSIKYAIMVASAVGGVIAARWSLLKTLYSPCVPPAVSAHLPQELPNEMIQVAIMAFVAAMAIATQVLSNRRTRTEATT